MRKWRTIRRALARTMAAGAIGALLCGFAAAQVSSYGDKDEGPNSGNQLPTVLQRVGVNST